MKNQHERTKSKANADLADELDIGTTVKAIPDAIDGFKDRALREERSLKEPAARANVPKIDTMATTFGKERGAEHIPATESVAELKKE